MSELKFSVIVTNYNYGRYLKQSIDSVLSQSYTNWELIIVDDCSSDDSRAIIDEYCDKHPNIHRIFNAKNGGQTYSFNAAYKMATGDIIALLDSDDYWFPEMLSYKAESHTTYPERVMCDTALSVDGLNIWTNPRTDLNYHELFLKYGYVYPYTPTSGLSIKKQNINRFMPLIDTSDIWGGLDIVVAHISLAQSQPIIDARIGGIYRRHEQNNVNRTEYYTHYLLNLNIERRLAQKQLEKQGVFIPTTENVYFDKVAVDFTGHNAPPPPPPTEDISFMGHLIFHLCYASCLKSMASILLA